MLFEDFAAKRKLDVQCFENRPKGPFRYRVQVDSYEPPGKPKFITLVTLSKDLALWLASRTFDEMESFLRALDKEGWENLAYGPTFDLKKVDGDKVSQLLITRSEVSSHSVTLQVEWR